MLNDVKTILAVFVVVILASLAWLGYHHVLDKGRAEAKLECQQEKAKYEAELQQKIKDLEVALTETAQASEQKQQELGKTIRDIRNRLKNQPISIIEAGQCMPSVIFIDSINKAITKANRE
jgi:flagellar biosynthesis component FlhA